MDQSSWDDTLVGVKPPRSVSREAVSSQSSWDKRTKLSIEAISWKEVKPSANSLSLVRFDRNDYSVPSAFAHHALTVVGGIEQVRIVEGTRLVATHPRCWEAER